MPSSPSIGSLEASAELDSKEVRDGVSEDGDVDKELTTINMVNV